MGGEAEYGHVKGWINRLAAIDPTTGLLNRHGWITSAVRQKRLGVIPRESIASD
jgi:hypothetical protein